MIQTPTVLVLGAGASKPYGLPTAPELKDRILSLTASDRQRMCLPHNRALIEETHSFQEEFGTSITESVDAFLLQRPQFLAAGKRAIAFCLLGMESRKKVIEGRDWLVQLFKLMDADASCDTFADNQLSVVTFNYDRSFEYALAMHLKHGFGATCETIEAVFRSIPIIHPYGRLGELALHEDSFGYGHTLDGPIIGHVGERIRLLADELEKSTEFIDAQQLVSKAVRVIFLGFSFHPVNVERLWLACGYGMTPGEQRVAANRVPSGIYPYRSLHFVKREDSRAWLKAVIKPSAEERRNDPDARSMESILFAGQSHSHGPMSLSR